MKPFMLKSGEDSMNSWRAKSRECGSYSKALASGHWRVFIMGWKKWKESALPRCMVYNFVTIPQIKEALPS